MGWNSGAQQDSVVTAGKPPNPMALPAWSSKQTLVRLQRGEIRGYLHCLFEFKMTAHEEAMLSWPTDHHGILVAGYMCISTWCAHGSILLCRLVPAEKTGSWVLVTGIGSRKSGSRLRCCPQGHESETFNGVFADEPVGNQCSMMTSTPLVCECSDSPHGG